jgi:diguanylate cyclase (GGDEF)-like protein/PAS domain S-box-containing protein
LKRNWSLKWSLPLGFGLAWLLVLGATLFNAIRTSDESLRDFARSTAAGYAADLARNAEQGWATAPSLVESNLALLATDPAVHSVVLLDASGRVLAAHRQAWVGRKIDEVWPGFDGAWVGEALSARLPRVRADATGLQVEAAQSFGLAPAGPGSEARSRGLAYVALDYSPARAERLQRLLEERAAEMIVIPLVLLVLGVVLWRGVGRPLERLAQAVRAVRQGRYDTRVPVDGLREIAELGDAFNAMAQAVEEAQAALKAKEDQLAITLDSIGDGLVATDAQGRITGLNPAARSLCGWDLAAAVGRPIEEVLVLVDGASGAPVAPPVYRAMREGRTVGLSNHVVLITADGQRRHVADSAAPIRDARGDVQGAVLVFRDVTEAYLMRKALADSEQHFRSLANAGLALIWTADAQGARDYFNEPWLAFTGQPFDAQRGDGWLQGMHPEDRLAWRAAFEAAARVQGDYRVEYRLRHADGDYRWVLEQARPRRDSDGLFIGYVGHCLDVTHEKAADAEIERLAYHDALTGLPNRVLFRDRLEQALAHVHRSGRHGAVLFLDLDQFKRINDLYGHSLGDVVLVEMAQRLRGLLREGDTVARLGGDEFVVLLGDLAGEAETAAAQAMNVAEKVRASIEQPVRHDGLSLTLATSIGVRLLSRDVEDIDDVMRTADMAMYRAKAEGRNRVAFFEAAMQASLLHRYELEQDLRAALGLGQFELWVQAQFEGGGKMSGAEALVRWRHPVRGLVSPAEFIPIAEETGLIVPLGAWVLRSACEAIRALQGAGRSLRISVNVSARQFLEHDFIAQVREILEQSGADPSRLTLELTESVLIDSFDVVAGRMRELHALGIRFSLDDFGTGYSSLAYLKRLPLSELKIDRSFVRDVPADPEDAALVEGIIAVAHLLHLDVVAEGVETPEQQQFLRAAGCGSFQGFLLHRPQPIDDWLQDVFG